MRERREDIAPLAEAQVDRCLQRLGTRLDPVRALAPLLPRLRAYDWPGNIRELENLGERIAVFLMQFDRLEDVRYDELRHDLPELFADAEPEAADTAGLSAARVAVALQAQGGNRQAAARQLGVSRSTLWRWMRERGADTPG
ncbi:Propionate catabolism operon regulatory protein [compost metagenome]